MNGLGNFRVVSSDDEYQKRVKFENLFMQTEWFKEMKSATGNLSESIMRWRGDGYLHPLIDEQYKKFLEHGLIEIF